MLYVFLLDPLPKSGAAGAERRDRERDWCETHIA
jgi:hypothetical protein